LRGLFETFKYQTVTAEDVFNYINKKTGTDYTYFLNQYLRFTRIPQLEVMTAKRGDTVTARYRWIADVPDFRMPIKVTTSRNTYEFIYPTTSWQTMALGDILPEEFKIADDLFLAELRLRWIYLDPNLQMR
jgi:hypothetical protein